MRRWRAMVGVGLPCSLPESPPAVWFIARMRFLESDTSVSGGTTWCSLPMVGAAGGHGVGVGSQGGMSRKHIGVDKRDGAELNPDEPDTDSAG